MKFVTICALVCMSAAVRVAPASAQGIQVGAAGGTLFEDGNRGWSALADASLPLGPLRAGAEIAWGETSDEDLFASGEPAVSDSRTLSGVLKLLLAYPMGELVLSPGFGAGVAQVESTFNSEEQPDERNTRSSTVPLIAGHLDLSWRVVEPLDLFAGARFHWLDFEEAAQMIVIGARITFD